MSGFFTVTDLPARRVVQYKRVSGSVDGAVHVDDESVLGVAVDAMPYTDKTGISISAGGTLFEVPYLADAGDVYIDGQPADGAVGDLLSVSARAGKEPHAFSGTKTGRWWSAYQRLTMQLRPTSQASTSLRLLTLKALRQYQKKLK